MIPVMVTVPVPLLFCTGSFNRVLLMLRLPPVCWQPIVAVAVGVSVRVGVLVGVSVGVGVKVAVGVGV